LHESCIYEVEHNSFTPSNFSQPQQEWLLEQVLSTLSPYYLISETPIMQLGAVLPVQGQ